MKTEYSALAGAVLLTLANGAGANEPMTLNDAQMDGITAGAAVLPLAVALGATSGAAYGTVFSGTSGAALAATSTVGPATAAAQASQVSIGISAFTPTCATCGAAAASASQSAAAVQ